MRLFSGSKRAVREPVRVVLYSKADCHLCDVAKEQLRQLQKEMQFGLQVVDILSDPKLSEEYGEQIPVVLMNGRKVFKYRIDPVRFRRLYRELAGGG